MTRKTKNRVTKQLVLFVASVLASLCSYQHVYSQDIPDIRSVAPDLTLPHLEDGPPRAGKRVKQSLAGYDASQLYHVLYLPINYHPSKKHPVIVEFAGNGGYRNQFGDTCDGVPEGSRLGYGISGGKDFVWICLPFVNSDGSQIAKKWWGSPPDYAPQTTVAYAKSALAELETQLGIDTSAVLLCGFSRGAIACNFIGLHDSEIAQLWCGFVSYSHYDGVHNWGLPGMDKDSALERLKRVGGRPQFICHEFIAAAGRLGLHKTEAFIRSSGISGNFTFIDTGFRNHNDAWILRESPTRERLRTWVRAIPAIESALVTLAE